MTKGLWRPLIGGIAIWLAGSAFVQGAEGDTRIIDAAKAGDVTAVRRLVTQNADVNAPASDNATALHWAVHRGAREIVDLLLEAGARINVANDYGVTPIALAAENGDRPLVERLLAAGADPNAASLSGETVLMTAVRTGRPPLVRALLSGGAVMNAREQTRGQTALMWAAEAGYTDVVRLLLEHGADVRARSNNGFTSMMFAARTSDVNLVMALLSSGADLNGAANDGTTPLLIATIRGNLDVVEFLLNQGADPNIDLAGYTALHWAAGTWETFLTGPTAGITAEDSEWFVLAGLRGAPKLKLVKLLLSFGADPNIRVKKSPPRYGLKGSRIPGRNAVGATTFWLAANTGDASVMRVLAADGADTVLSSDQESTPLMMAAGLDFLTGVSRVREEDALDAVKVAVDLGASIAAENQYGDTAMHAAALWGATTIVQFLAERGANVNAKNKLGQTPLMMANGEVRVSNANTAYPDTVRALRELGAME